MYDDAAVASSLCFGGAIAYVPTSDDFLFVTDDWLMEHVVPNIARKFGQDRQLCRILGRALLYACLDDNLEDYIPGYIRDRVVGAYLPAAAAVGVQGDPIKRESVVMWRVQDTLVCKLATAAEAPVNAAVNPEGHPPPVAQGTNEQLSGLHIQLQALQQQVATMQQLLENNLHSLSGGTRSNIEL